MPPPGAWRIRWACKGPCMAIDTACSSSLGGAASRLPSLRNGESDLALAGGVNVILTPDAFVCFSQMGHDGPRWPLQNL